MAWLRSALATFAVLILPSICFAGRADRIAGAINSGQTVRVSASRPLQARPEFDRGRVDPSLKLSYITLLTVPSASQQKAIDRLLSDQQNPHSANYHKWLTPEQYADRFGLSQNDIQKLSAWLRSQGFTVVRTARGRNWIVFSGTAAQVESAFQTEIHNFDVNGELHFANVRPPSVPAAFSGTVVGMRGLNNFRPKSDAKQGQPQYFYQAQNYCCFVAPGDVATIYDIPSSLDGSGQKIAVMGQTGIYWSDLANFRNAFGLSANTCSHNGSGIITSCNTSNFKYVLVNGSATTIYGDLPEADIDLEWSGATARNAQIIYVNSTDPNGFGVWDSWYYSVDNVVAPVMTMSYTSPCELIEAEFPGSGKGSMAGDEAELAKANLEGITFMNSSGDSGVAECDYQTNVATHGYAAAYPASSQYITAVGGTSIPIVSPNEYTSTYWSSSNGSTGGSALSYIPEQPWNDAQEFGIFCQANPGNQFCTANGISGWSTAQQNAIGISSGGGGISSCTAINGSNVCQSGFAQPSWQSGISAAAINPNGLGVTTTPTRYYPDVSLLASPNFPGYLICTQASALGGSGGSTCNGGITQMLSKCFAGTAPCSIFGGTSVSAPVFAGMVALLNQSLGAQGLGNINPALYALAANPGNGAFHPVTTNSTGSYSNGAFCTMGTPANQPASLQCPSSGPSAGFIGFSAYNADPTTSYNLVTGLGSVDVGNLAAAFSAYVSDFTFSTSTGPQTVSAGQTASYSFTATPPSGFSTFPLAVSFSCSSLPSNSNCTFSPTSLAAGSPATTVTVMINTLGPCGGGGCTIPGQAHRASIQPSNHRSLWLPLAAPLAAIFLTGISRRKLSRNVAVLMLCLSLIALGALVACGGGSSSGGGQQGPPAISVSVSAVPTSLYPNNTGHWPSQTAQFTATVHNSNNQGVTWSVTGGSANGTIDANGLYTAPQIVSGLPSSVTIVATAAADTTKSGSAKETLTPATVPGTYNVNVSATSGGSGPAPTTVQVTVQ